MYSILTDSLCIIFSILIGLKSQSIAIFLHNFYEQHQITNKGHQHFNQSLKILSLVFLTSGLLSIIARLISSLSILYENEIFTITYLNRIFLFSLLAFIPAYYFPEIVKKHTPITFITLLSLVIVLAKIQ